MNHLETEIALAIRDELKAQRKPVEFDLDQVVRAIAAVVDEMRPSRRFGGDYG